MCACTIRWHLFGHNNACITKAQYEQKYFDAKTWVPLCIITRQLLWPWLAEAHVHRPLNLLYGFPFFLLLNLLLRCVCIQIKFWWLLRMCLRNNIIHIHMTVILWAQFHKNLNTDDYCFPQQLFCSWLNICRHHTAVGMIPVSDSYTYQRENLTGTQNASMMTGV